nr:hypothetical protein [Tanacetum cinerariifolium]
MKRIATVTRLENRGSILGAIGKRLNDTDPFMEVLRKNSLFLDGIGLRESLRDLMIPIPLERLNELTRKERCNVTMLTEAPTSSHFLSQLLSRKVIELELPADVDGDTEGKQPVQNVQNFTYLKCSKFYRSS